MSENTNPLLPNYPFNLELVAGITQIEEGNYLDFTINRPHGMNGYILHLTTLGKGTIFDGQDFFMQLKGNSYFSPLKPFITTTEVKKVNFGLTSGFIFILTLDGGNG
ncbi:hypothetical protein ACMXZF_09355 [Pasteurella multocida]|uniref:hypothetical protein n=1 Tax=Pasteurella multocida TaxID=747 RepID=UPI0032F70173|nr:hypothetical protein [Pasteurella multocida]